MGNRFRKGEPLRKRALFSNDEVDPAIAATQTVIQGVQQTIRVRGKVGARDFSLFIRDCVNKPWILMREPVMFLSPQRGSQEVIERRYRGSPVELPGHFEKFGILIHHRGNDWQESLIGRERPLSSCKQIALEPGLAPMLDEHLYYPTPLGAS